MTAEQVLALIVEEGEFMDDDNTWGYLIPVHLLDAAREVLEVPHDV